ncbi:GtrA family protein [Photobacterium leiognathi]
MFKLFLKYASVGVINTLIHWTSFFILNEFISQGLSNVIAFSIAVTFSFFINSKFTFKSNVSLYRYLIYVIFLGVLAYVIGEIAENIAVNPFMTLLSFSLVSLIIGFLYSKYIVFKE